MQRMQLEGDPNKYTAEKEASSRDPKRASQAGSRKPNALASGRQTSVVAKIQAKAIQNIKRCVGLGVQITKKMSA